jgi:anti-sigma B factor antagonist
MSDPEAQPSAYPGELEIVRLEAGDGATLFVRGEVDLASAFALDRELRDAEAPRVQRIVIDLGGLEFMDSTGIHVLIEAHLRAAANGRQLVLKHVPAHARRLFSLTGIDARFSIE